MTTTGGTPTSQAIASNPKHIQDGEGIWYVIQNKADVDTDLGAPARRLALQAFFPAGSTNLSAKLAEVPLTGNYDAFLWKVVSVDASSGTYHLANKKHSQNLNLNSNEVWSIDQMNLSTMGTNAYYIQQSATQAVGLSAINEAVVTTKEADSTAQTWIFQPMELQVGYHIPKSPATISSHNPPSNPSTIDTGEFTKTLSMDNGFTIFATSTTSDWAILNVHNIHTNMMNALKSEHKPKINAYASNARKEILICSGEDGNNAFWNYPMIFGHYDIAYISEKRGGVHNYPTTANHYAFLTWVSEEMMCRTGTVQKTVNDDTKREFDQVVHEFAHSIDFACQLNSETATANPHSGSLEWFPQCVQYWFNSLLEYPHTNRNWFKSSKLTEFNFVAGAFEESNTWLPPRRLRTTHFSDSKEAAAFQAELGPLKTDIEKCREGLTLLENNKYIYTYRTTSPIDKWRTAFTTFKTNHLPACKRIGAFLARHAGTAHLANIETAIQSDGVEDWNGYWESRGGIVFFGNLIMSHCPGQHLLRFDCKSGSNEVSRLIGLVRGKLDLLYALG